MGDWKKKGSKPVKRYGGMCACILITFTDLWQQNNVAFSSIDSCCRCVLVYRHKYICCFHCCEQHCFFMRFCVACTCFLFPSYWTDEQRSNGINLCFTVHGSVVNDSYGLFPLLDSDSDSDSDTDSCTIQILWEKDLNLNLCQWKHVLHDTM